MCVVSISRCSPSSFISWCLLIVRIILSTAWYWLLGINLFHASKSLLVCVFINEFTTPLLSILGVTTTLCYELLVQLWQLIAHHQGWLSRWLETDSMLVSLAFKYSKIVPWSLQNRWSNCLHLLFSMNFHVSRIYKEGNKCADTLANLGLTLASYCWFSQPPPHIRINLESNKLGLPNFRFS